MGSKEGIEGYAREPAYEDAARWVILMVRAMEKSEVGFGGFSVRPRGDEMMMVLRGERGTMRLVAFVFSKDFGGLLRAALRRARADKLRWQKDKYYGTTDK